MKKSKLTFDIVIKEEVKNYINNEYKNILLKRIQMADLSEYLTINSNTNKYEFSLPIKGEFCIDEINQILK